MLKALIGKVTKFRKRRVENVTCVDWINSVLKKSYHGAAASHTCSTQRSLPVSPNILVLTPEKVMKGRAELLENLLSPSLWEWR